MSFLDEHTLDLTRPEVPELRNLFVSAYPFLSGAQELAETAGIRPGMFPLQDNMRATWYELIKVMSRQGKLRRMVEIAAADETNSV